MIPVFLVLLWCFFAGDLENIGVSEYFADLFKVNNKDTRTTSVNVVLMYVFLTLSTFSRVFSILI